MLKFYNYKNCEIVEYSDHTFQVIAESGYIDLTFHSLGEAQMYIHDNDDTCQECEQIKSFIRSNKR